MKSIIVLVIAVLVAGCAGGYDYWPPRSAQERQEVDRLTPRVARVAHQLAGGNGDVCQLAKAGCGLFYAVAMGPVGAGTDGKRVIVTNDTIRFFANDDELAIVLAHE